jgi:cytochrome c553
MISRSDARFRCILILTGAIMSASGPASVQFTPSPQSAQEAVCSSRPVDARAPPANSLHAMSPDFIVEALTNGIMKAQGSSLSPEQRASLAEYLTGQPPSTPFRLRRRRIAILIYVAWK